MMPKSSGLLILLLIIAIIAIPLRDVHNEPVTVSPQTVCGDTAPTEQTDSQDDTVKIVIVVVVVIIIIWFITSISDTPSYSQGVKADWKLF